MDGENENENAWPGMAGFWREWVAPVAIAGVLALGVAGTVELINSTDEKPAKDKKRPATQTLLASQKRAAPGFVVAVQRSGTGVVVRDVVSGATIDQTMPPPAGQHFQQVAAAPDGSYLISGYGRERVSFYRLRLSGAGRAQSFTTVPRAIAGVSTAWSDMAVSADGDKVGYVTYQGGKGRINVISLRSGAHRMWDATSDGRLGSLSWAGGTLSFVWSPVRQVGGRAAPAGHQVRTLDTTAPGGDLRASRAVLTLPRGGDAAVLSRDARTVVTGVRDRSGVALAAFSTATGRQTRVLRRFAASALTGLTLDGVGSHLLVMAGDGRLYADSTQPVRRLSSTDYGDIAW